MKKYSFGVAVAAGLLASGLNFGSSAQAADLGGNCCADLEERIAELEATTVRKGNRKVSLTISGWVAEQVMWWDDGTESNVYVTGVGTTLSSHFKMTGAAQITPGWTAGYVLHVEVGTADPLTSVDQHHDDGGEGVRAYQSYWFLKSESLGKLSLGQLSPASDNAAILVDGSGSLVPANWVLFDNQAFGLRVNGIYTGANWGDLAQCQSWGTGGLGAAGDCGGFAGPGNYIRYDTPTFGGFSASASWGEDDAWDAAVRYAGEFAGFKVAATGAYFSQNDTSNVLGHDRGSNWQVGAYVQHIPTGLFAYGAYGADINTPDGAYDFGAERWYVKAGLRQRWTSLGHTVLYGEYGQKNDNIDCGRGNGNNAYNGTNDQAFDCDGANHATGGQLTQWGLGVVQEIDSAAMSLWLSYRHFDGEIDCTAGGCGSAGLTGRSHYDFDSMQIVKFGALINF